MNCLSGTILSDRHADAYRVYDSITEYCDTYNIPLRR